MNGKFGVQNRFSLRQRQENGQCGPA